MRVAALYDVHGMPWALEAVLAEADADVLLFGGDFIAGPYPQETLQRVRALDAIHIRGNCERDAGEWDRTRVAADDLAWARALPLTAEVDGVLYCHAAPDDDLPVTTEATPDDLVARTFAGTSGTVVIGHTHHQFDRRVADVRVVNAGSVGMPYEGEVAAFWLIVDDGEPSFRKTSFDVDRAAAEIRASGWPQADAFVAENVLTAVTREEAIPQLEQARG